MAGTLATYNRDIMAIGCRKCGAVPLQRCLGRRGGGPQHSHAERRSDAGWRWDLNTKTLERVNEDSSHR
jgi:hypothetical protein